MNKRIRILFTISNFNTAGSGKVVYDLVYGLDKVKFDIEIACEDERGDFYKKIKALNLPVHLFETKTNYRPYYSLLFRVLKISKFYKKQRYDIVHSWQWSNDWTEALAARLIGKKWIYTKKAMGFANNHWKIKSRLANFIITINDEMHQYFPNKKGQKLIPLGIDTEYYSPVHFTNLKKEKTDVFHVIMVANLVPVKGLEVLINAIHKLNDKQIKLTILGNKSNDYGRNMVALTKSLKLENQVEFLGKKPDVRPYFLQADLYVIPTLDQGRKEGMPMALVEAMSMGIPLLGADISGINFVLKDFKELLFTAGNTEVLAQRIKFMQDLEQIEREQIGAALRQYCVDHFTMDSFIKEHEELYLKLVD